MAIMQHVAIAFQLSKRDVLLMSFCNMMGNCWVSAQVGGFLFAQKTFGNDVLLKHRDGMLFNCR
jgi:hypothetical protein